MAAKRTFVELICPAHNLSGKFEIAHAERLLAMRKNGGWQLPENSKYTFDKDNGIRVRANKERDSRATEERND